MLEGVSLQTATEHTVAIVNLGAAEAASRLGVLSSPTEVAIGIAVAYLGFDRFRYERQIRYLALRKSREVMTVNETLRTAIQDGEINNDEKGILTLFYYGGDEEFRRFLQRKEIKDVLAENDFFNGRCAFVMKVFAHWRLDRRIEQVLLVLLCGWVVLSTIVLHGFEMPPAWMSHPYVGIAYYLTVSTAIALPGVAFFLSEWMMARIKKHVDSWVKSLKVSLKREAGTMTFGPNAPPAEQ